MTKPPFTEAEIERSQRMLGDLLGYKPCPRCMFQTYSNGQCDNAFCAEDAELASIYARQSMRTSRS
jgi:hypothetical protein